jgi:hypothetical protein
VVTVVVAGGALILLMVSVICLAAYMIDAESFEVKSRIWKIISLSIRIESSRRHHGEGGSSVPPSPESPDPPSGR